MGGFALCVLLIYMVFRDLQIVFKIAGLVLLAIWKTGYEKTGGSGGGCREALCCNIIWLLCAVAFI